MYVEQWKCRIKVRMGRGYRQMNRMKRGKEQIGDIYKWLRISIFKERWKRRG